ncbi:MAG: anthranilate phosphoribosyltransferase [Phycisphaerae bacterium]
MNHRADTLIDAVRAGRDLSRTETAELFAELMGGRLDGDRIASLLIGLAEKGETVDEIVGAAQVMRRHFIGVGCDDADAIDTCGTGGDGISTFNVSTVAAIVAAAAGARVAKHGNRTNTRRSGSAEALAQLGVNIDAPNETVVRCLREIGIAFLYAARLHPAMRHAAEVRRRLGRPTLFNLLGPLTNPAGVRRQVVGVPRVELTDRIARALRELGAVHALVVHGGDGLCDLTVTAPSVCVELRDGNLTTNTVTPEDVGLARGPLDALRIDGPAASADAIRAILAGESGPRRDHTLLNAAAALVVAGIATDLADGVTRGAAAIDSGAARAKLNQWITGSRVGG